MSGDSFALPISKFAANTREATTLFEELRKPLLRYLVSLGLSPDEAQDVVQDSFLCLHRSLTSGASKENARAWLFRVAHNAARNRQKSYHRRFTSALEDTALEIADASTPEHAVLEEGEVSRSSAQPSGRSATANASACCCAPEA